MNILALNSFQILLLIVLAMLLVGSVVATLRGWATRREGTIWVALCAAAAVVTIWPKLTGRVADALGIGRGADLVFYCAVVVMMVGFWVTYMRLRYLRRELTLLVRRIAIIQAEETPPSTDLEATSAASQRPDPKAD